MRSLASSRRNFQAINANFHERKGWAASVCGKRRTLQLRPVLEGFDFLLRIFPRRHGRRAGRESPDGLDRFGGETSRTERGIIVSLLAEVQFGREICGDLEAAEKREWLVTNGLGGYASGTVAGTATRRYHGLLMAALKPPAVRTLL